MPTAWRLCPITAACIFSDLHSNSICGNLVGIAPNLILPLPNGGHGISLRDSSGNTVGMDGPGRNVIAYNEDGVLVKAGTKNAIRYNAFFDNRRLGINLVGNDQASGVTLNDELDPDTGPNDRQNFPVLDAVQSNSRHTVIQGTMPGKVFSRYFLQFFVKNNPNDSAYGEGARWQADRWVSTDMIGLREFLVVLYTPVPVGQHLTATATDEQNNTSEFSRAVRVQPAEDGDADGVEDLVEGSGPNSGDANQDGVPDYEQKYVVSIPAETPRYEFLTLSTASSQEIRNARTVPNPSPTNAPAGVEFPLGLISFEIHKAFEGRPTRIEIAIPPGVTVNTYWKYGPTPDNPTPHWYRFTYDGTQGAILEGAKYILYIVDGGRGDDDLTVNGLILDVGAPAYEPELRLRYIRHLADGQVQLQLQCPRDANYRLEASTNLIDWTELWRTNTPAGVLDITDTNAPAFRHRFYRARESR